ncbi:hypothetical protein GWC95_10360 [Sediminibacterium roseum]|uniref:Uncharacterized protein n=1 Tax=Sediminibacterium roseum TaxID=1978412 RepID=A0ABW9ZV15_9BACT|nr:hypothetical protein [Sediminibacterium roseum]NCI50325.1 hypothetical protein [Sediminibacterium roseum]
MEENQPLETVHEQFLFEMHVVCAADIIGCSVFAAVQRDGTKFTRVLYGPADDVRAIDVDYWEEIGWIDMWYGEPSPWSAMVGPALDYHFALRKKA